MANPEETGDQVAKARLALEAAEAEHAAALGEADDNRSHEEQIVDLLEAMVMRFGNRPDFRAKIDRIKAKVLVAPASAAPAGEHARAE